jgi:hypothetical protein
MGTQCLCEGGALLIIQIGQQNVPAFLDDTTGLGSTQSSRSAGNDRYLSTYTSPMAMPLTLGCCRRKLN